MEHTTFPGEILFDRSFKRFRYYHIFFSFNVRHAVYNTVNAIIISDKKAAAADRIKQKVYAYIPRYTNRGPVNMRGGCNNDIKKKNLKNILGVVTLYIYLRPR